MDTFLEEVCSFQQAQPLRRKPVESGKNLGQKVNEKFFRVDPGKKIQKSEKNIIFR